MFSTVTAPETLAALARPELLILGGAVDHEALFEIARVIGLIGRD